MRKRSAQLYSTMETFIVKDLNKIIPAKVFGSLGYWVYRFFGSDS